MKTALALFFYAAALFFIYAASLTPEWQALSNGFPQTDKEIGVALMIGVGMISKLFGHVLILSHR